MGHFSKDPKCPAKGQKCRLCGEIGHFKVKCPKQVSSKQQQKHVDRDKVRTGFKSGKTENSASTNFVDERCPEKPQSYAQSEGALRNYAFTVDDDAQGHSGSITLEVGGVKLPDILIDSGATCNLIGQSTWEWLKSQCIQCTSRKEAKVLYAYGCTKPIPTLGTLTASIVAPNQATCRADFVVIQGKGRSLLCRETAEMLNLLRISPV